MPEAVGADSTDQVPAGIHRGAPLRDGDPRRLGRYELVAVLGEGGMGRVYLARGDGGRHVAIKVIRREIANDADFRRRFRNEVSRARQVPPFSTAEVIDADPDHDPPYLVVEYVDGPDLADVVTREGPLTAANLHAIAVGVAAALTAIHDAGVIHRDLKPANVLLARGSPKVIDFGIAKPAINPTGDTDGVLGTIPYMAPEQFYPAERANPTPATDIFAWGAIVAFAATGRSPFSAESTAAVIGHILHGTPDLTGLAEPLRGLVEQALTNDPHQRPTARQLLDRLTAARSATTTQPTHDAAPAPRNKPTSGSLRSGSTSAPVALGSSALTAAGATASTHAGRMTVHGEARSRGGENPGSNRTKTIAVVSSMAAALIGLLSSPVWGPPTCRAVAVCEQDPAKQLTQRQGTVNDSRRATPSMPQQSTEPPRQPPPPPRFIPRSSTPSTPPSPRPSSNPPTRRPRGTGYPYYAGDYCDEFVRAWQDGYTDRALELSTQEVVTLLFAVKPPTNYRNDWGPGGTSELGAVCNILDTNRGNALVVRLFVQMPTGRPGAIKEAILPG